MESALCILVSFAAVFRLVTSRNPPLWRGGLRDVTRLKNGCEGDYVYPEVKKKRIIARAVTSLTRQAIACL